MTIINDKEYFQLSTHFNYLLSGKPVDYEGVLNLILGENNISSSKEILLEVLVYLGSEYGSRTRRLGPFSLLHLLRSAYMLNKSTHCPSLIDVLSTLLHDLKEDIFIKEHWRNIEKKATFLNRLDKKTKISLTHRLELLTRKEGEPYYKYIGRILKSPDSGTINIKLIDRIDNTFDLRIDIASENKNCYELIFNVLFCESCKSSYERYSHPSTTRLRGSERLYQLFKNCIFLSLCRLCNIRTDETYLRLFSSLASASLNEAMNILVHLFTYHIPDPQIQKKLLYDVLTYSEQGGLDHITESQHHALDGLFCRFGSESKQLSLDEVYKDKHLMAMAAVAFMVIFTNFLKNPDFKLCGISPKGIFPSKKDK